MAILLLSLIVLYSIICVVPSEAQTTDELFSIVSNEMKSKAKDEENPEQPTADIFESYYTEIDQVVSGTTFEEIIHEIFDRTSSKAIDFERYNACEETEEAKSLHFSNCSIQIFSIHHVLESTSLSLQQACGEIRRAKEFGKIDSNSVKTSFLYLEVGMDKLQKANSDLKKYSSNLNDKVEHLLNMNYRLHSSANVFNEELESRIENACTDIDKVISQLDDDAKTINELITETKNTQTSFKNDTENVEPLVKLAAAYDNYQRAHGIELSDDSTQRVYAHEKRLEEEMFVGTLLPSILYLRIFYQLPEEAFFKQWPHKLRELNNTTIKDFDYE